MVTKKYLSIFMILFLTIACFATSPNKGSLSGNMIHTILAPVSINGGKSCDVTNLAKYNHASFIVSCGNMAGGTSTLTVEYCDDNVPTTDTAMAFNYRKMTDGAGATDTMGDLTAATSAGISLATTNETVIVELDAIEINQASTGANTRVILKMTDPSAAAYVSAVAYVCEARYASGTPVTVID